MSYYLDPGRHTVQELAEEYRLDERDDLEGTQTADLLAVALVETSTLSGDDPAKWAAMQHLVAALRRIDRRDGAETSIEVDDTSITVTREESAQSR